MSNLKLLEPIVPPRDAAHEIASREKALRRSQGITQSELVTRSQVNIGAIRRFEQTGQISFESLVKICRALDCEGDLDGLFSKPPYRSTADVLAAQKAASQKAAAR